ncbi:YceD family protein [Pediococcus siamensis]|uniref:YceD family protein n=1 Tax=Pediococcus siamensis TaxID=381829 RepID=UPI0039A1F70A
MNWSLSDLMKHKEPLHFTESLDLKADLVSRMAEILDVKDIQVDGYAIKDRGAVLISAQVTGRIVVPSSRSLQPVDLKLDFTINEYYVAQGTSLERFDATDTVLSVEDDQIDFSKAVADNIILQIPMQIFSPEEINGEVPMPTGEGWQVISEQDEQEAQTKQVDPRLAKLKDLLHSENNESE